MSTGKGLRAKQGESRGVVKHAGDFLVCLVQEEARILNPAARTRPMSAGRRFGRTTSSGEPPTPGMHR